LKINQAFKYQNLRINALTSLSLVIGPRKGTIVPPQAQSVQHFNDFPGQACLCTDQQLRNFLFSHILAAAAKRKWNTWGCNKFFDNTWPFTL